MRLNKDAVDLFDIHDAGLVADSFFECAETQVAGATQETFAGAHDQGQRFGREGVVTQAGSVQLIGDKLFHRFGNQA